MYSELVYQLAAGQDPKAALEQAERRLPGSGGLFGAPLGSVLSPSSPLPLFCTEPELRLPGGRTGRPSL